MNWKKRKRLRGIAKKHNKDHYWQYYNLCIKWKIHISHIQSFYIQSINDIEKSSDSMMVKNIKLASIIKHTTDMLETAYHSCFHRSLFYIDRNNLYVGGKDND